MFTANRILATVAIDDHDSSQDGLLDQTEIDQIYANFMSFMPGAESEYELVSINKEQQS